jgi:hypothetical protein
MLATLQPLKNAPQSHGKKQRTMSMLDVYKQTLLNAKSASTSILRKNSLSLRGAVTECVATD